MSTAEMQVVTQNYQFFSFPDSITWQMLVIPQTKQWLHNWCRRTKLWLQKFLAN